MLLVGNRLYLAGTRLNNPQDLDADFRAYLNNIESSYKYKIARNAILQNNVTHVIGYSLGGALADALTSDMDEIHNARIYNSPSITRKNSHKQQIFYNDNDPVQGLFKSELGEGQYYKGSKKGHTLSGHQLIYS